MLQRESDRDGALRRFFLALRIAFKTAPMYPPDHPSFLKALDGLHDKLGTVLAIAPVLTIKSTPRSLFVDGRFWDDDRVASDLARLFHLRKIQSLEIRTGIPLEELRAFAVRVTRPVEEIIRLGGLRKALNQDGLGFISVDELDYSQLLKGEGEEIKDLWPYLLLEAAEADDTVKMEMFVRRMQNEAVFADPDAILDRDDVQDGLSKLFKYVKEQDEDQYRVCAKTVVRSLVAAKKAPAGEKLANVQRWLSGLRDEDLASALWEQAIDVKGFDATGLAVFSQIVSPERQAGVEASLQRLVRDDKAARRGPEVKAKIMSLLSDEGGPYVSGVYRRTLADLLQEMTFEEKHGFDRDEVNRHYRYTLLNLSDRDEDPDSLVAHLDIIAGELPRIAEAKDWGAFRDLLDVLRRKETAFASHAPFEERMHAMRLFAEDLILDGTEGPEFDAMLPLMGGSARGEDEILRRMFEARTVTPLLMKFLLQNSSPDLGHLQERIRRAAADGPLLERIADALAAVDSRSSVELLKLLYASGSADIRVKVLSILKSQTTLDEPFLFSALKSEDQRLRAGALANLARTERTRHVALRRMLTVGSPFGWKNRTILQNLDIIEAMGVREAAPQIRTLISRAGFWNSAIRRAGRRILEAWHEG